MSTALEQTLTREDVAKLLRVSMATVDRYIVAGRRTRGRHGIWPVHRLSHRVLRIPPSAVDRFLKAQMR